MQYFKITINPTSTVYRPIDACAYSAIYVFKVPAKGPPEDSSEVPNVDSSVVPTTKQIVFEYAVPRNVPQKQHLRAFRKKNVHKNDVVMDINGNEVFKHPEELYVIEEVITVPEMMSVPVTNPIEVAAIETYLESNSVNL